MALCCCAALVAQERVQRVITIKNGNLGPILRTMRELLPPGSNVLVSSDNEHLILSGPKEAVSGLEEVIKQLDVPPQAKNNVETTAYMIVASLQPANASPMPPDLEPVVTQLKALFPYKGYRLLDSFVLRSRHGEHGEASGFVPVANERSKILYSYQYNRVRIDKSEKGNVVRFDHLSLRVNFPIGLNAKSEVNYVTAGIETDVDVPEGKKVVVGKTSAVEGPDNALILVISAKVVD
jgi:hypothetical protein